MVQAVSTGLFLDSFSASKLPVSCALCSVSFRYGTSRLVSIPIFLRKSPWRTRVFSNVDAGFKYSSFNINYTLKSLRIDPHLRQHYI